MSDDQLQRLVPRMRPYAQSIFGNMGVLAQRTSSVNLGQGFPDTDGPVELQRIAIDEITSGRGNQYPPAHGQPALRAAISTHQLEWYGLEYDPADEVVVGTGASEVIASALLGLLNEGDELLAFEPAFDIYAAQTALAGGLYRTVALGPGFRPDLEALAAAITPRTRLLLINTPHNPTGAVYTRAELDGIAKLAIEHDLIVLSDEVYEHLLFDGVTHLSIATLPGMRERTITFGSGGKSFSFTGWKVGWACAPRDLMAAVRVVRQHLSYVSGGPFQQAIAAGLELPRDYFAGFAADLQGKRDYLLDGLRSIGLDPITPQGTYFIVSDMRPLGYDDGGDFAWGLPEKAGVACIPVDAFCQHRGEADHFVRWTFCKKYEVLDAAISRLQKTFN
ncbi:MAG: aminotransferase class I/II-fold pyridoxal phosphate-dependent enzyme [Actinobacteria bacterium]|nr:aminotransferase class I/II-fold pyridoxal phosphate-dependent enzyme [Actinomycetota bacterium]